MKRTRTIRRVATAPALLAAGLVVAGCGGDDTPYANEARAPAPINVSVAISDERVLVSPDSFGAGPISLVVSNQTDAPQKLTLESDDTTSDPGLTQSTGAINPRGTATLKVDVDEGAYALSVDGDGVRPATVEIGPDRPSSENDLLQP